MSKFQQETVTSVKHWNDTLFSFKTTRDAGFKFENGHFVMMGLETEKNPLVRAYSIASANYEDELEFFSIKVPNGPLTSKLQHLKVGDKIVVGKKALGTLVTDNLTAGKNLFLLSTGTGLAPFLSVIKDYQVYEQFERVILVHGVRYKSELAYADTIKNELPKNEYFGEEVKKKLSYIPMVTREDFHTNGRLTTLLENGELYRLAGLESPSTENDRFMICGGPSMLKDTTAILDNFGFSETRNGHVGEYVVERAFVES